jgi:hypothetical protein
VATSKRNSDQLSFVMLRPIRLLSLLAVPFILSACMLNAVRPLVAGEATQGGQPVLIYGVSVESGESTPKYFSVQLDLYDIERQNITGGCFRYDRAEAAVPGVPGRTQYFAFQVPAGFYVYSPFQIGKRFADTTRAFAVPETSVVYVGDFIYGRDGKVTLRRDLDEAKTWLHANMPGLEASVTLAPTRTVKRPNIFLCMP